MGKVRRVKRFRGLKLFLLAVGALFIAFCWWLFSPAPRRSPPPVGQAVASGRPTLVRVFGPGRTVAAEHCDAGPADSARRNLEGLRDLTLAPYGRVELGWATYAPLIAATIETACPPDSAGFAARLAAWQSAHGLTASGVLAGPEMEALKVAWQHARPFAVASVAKCPAPPDEATLATVPAAYAYGGKAMRLRPAALAAYEQMIAAARTEAPPLAADRRLMTIFSAYRSPASDAARCAVQNNCQNTVRAACSAHLTGLAMDLDLGSAPGAGPDSSDDANRRAITQGPAYLWMAANAHRFGFVPYPFEPWHWEWTGEPIEAGR